MSNNWVILEKVGRWAGLEGDPLYEYLEIANEKHDKEVQVHRSNYDFKSEYYEFLNDEVISSPVLIEYLAEASIPSKKLEQLQHGDVDLDQIAPPRHFVDYGLDEIVDFVMILKLLDEYHSQTGEARVAPLEKLHYFVFLTNHRISQDDDLVRLEDKLGLKNLQRTGFRYSFQKQNNLPYAQSLNRDKDRLLSWGLLEEQVLDNHQDVQFPFSISIGETGRFFFTRYGEKMDQFNSLLLKTWEEEQKKVLREFGASSLQAIRSYLESLDRVDDTNEGRVILPGRPMNFTDDEEEEESAQEGAVHG